MNIVTNISKKLIHVTIILRTSRSETKIHNTLLLGFSFTMSNPILLDILLGTDFTLGLTTTSIRLGFMERVDGLRSITDSTYLRLHKNKYPSVDKKPGLY